MHAQAVGQTNIRQIASVLALASHDLRLQGIPYPEGDIIPDRCVSAGVDRQRSAPSASTNHYHFHSTLRNDYEG